MDGIVWTIVGICAAALTSFSFLPQVTKILKCRSARDVSHITMWQLTAGNALWLTYGIGRHDWVIIGANIVAISILVAGLALYYRFRVVET
ncbi:MAG: SemiSWEET family transporter [Dehalococcoidales bacterium]|jgi:MtN3 and saliva related transmembrane protein